MWLADRGRERRERETAALGTVTLEGTPAGAYTDGERRALPVFGPGGLRWKPHVGQQVLVVKTGTGEELPCVAGARVEGGELLPGEAELFASDGGAAVRAGLGGRLELTGAVMVNGEPLEELVRRLLG